MYVPAVTSVIPIGLVVFVAVLPELDVAVKRVTALLPVLFAVKGTDTTPEVPPDAVPIVGACGFAVGTTAPDAPDGFEVPIAFVAVTVKVYDDAGAVFNPATIIGDPEPDPVCPPEDVTV